MSRGARGIVFDLDGTLIDSMPLVFRAYAHAMAPYAAPMTDEEWMAALGGPPERIFERLLPEPTARRDAQRRFDAFANDAWKAVEAFDGMDVLLDTLRAAGWVLALWTGRDRASTEWLLREHRIAEKFAACVCGDDLSTHKPDPAGLVEALRRIGVEPADALFVGDAEVDVLAGAALGVRTLLITHGRTPEVAVRAKAWAVVARPAEAYALLAKLRAGNLAG